MACVTTVNAEIYQWKDKDGKIHYGEHNAGTEKTDVKSVEIHDKYHISTVELLSPIKYTGTTAHRLINLNNIRLALPDSEIENVRIGRIICGSPIDLYWKEGVVDLLKPEILQGSISKFSELGYTVRNGINGTASPSSLSLELEIADLKINMCPSNNGKDVSQNATFLKVKWKMLDPLSGKEVFSGESLGSHDALSARPVKNGVQVSLAEALAVATNNILSDPDFIKAVAPVDMKMLAKKFDEKISVHVHFGSGNNTFKGQVESLMKNTVIVKTRDGFGSGVVLSDKGFILTNAHVVGEEKKFKVVLDGDTFDADLVRNSVVRDVALIKITQNISSASGVDIARELTKVGDEIYIIGAPLSLENSQTTTKGIVSAFREMQGLKYLQTDAVVNHGSSGGPVFNERGELVALTVAGLLTRDGAGLGINYLIPIDDVLTFLNIGDSANQNALLASANTVLETVSDLTDENSYTYKIKSVVLWLVNWLNSPLISKSSPTGISVSAIPANLNPAVESSGTSNVQVQNPRNSPEKVLNTYVAKDHFAQALLYASSLRNTIAAYYMEHDSWPTSFREIGINPADLHQHETVDLIELKRSGALHVVLSAVIFGSDQYFELTPDVSKSSEIGWKCKTTLDYSLWVGNCSGF